MALCHDRVRELAIRRSRRWAEGFKHPAMCKVVLDIATGIVRELGLPGRFR